MNKRRHVLLVMATVILVLAAVVVWPLPPKRADAVSAAMVVTTGTDPSAGEGATCHLAIGPRLLLLQYRYRCHLTSCGEESTPVVITYNRVTGEWRYELNPRDVRGNQPPTGKTGPEYGADPSSCEGQI